MYQNIEDPWNLVEKHEKEINKEHIADILIMSDIT